MNPRIVITAILGVGIIATIMAVVLIIAWIVNFVRWIAAGGPPLA